MKNKKILFPIIIISLILICTGSFLAYNKTTKKILQCPYSTLTWEDTIEDMTALEGENYTTYDSIYNGTTYTYNKKYLNTDGRIKYMFDDKEKLMCIAWTYSSEDSKSLSKLYDEIYSEITKYHGKSDKDSEGINNTGGVWHLKSGDIVLTTMNTDSNKALQFSFLSPEASKDK